VVLGDVLLDELGTDPHVIEGPIVARDIGRSQDLGPVPVLDFAVHVQDPDLELAVRQDAANPCEPAATGFQADNVSDTESLWAGRLARLGVFQVRSCRRATEGIDFARNPCDGIIHVAGGALLQWNDGVVRDLDVLGADFLAALGDVALADARLAVQQGGARARVQGVHLQGGDPDHVARPVVGGLVVVVAQDVADILAEEALDALAVLVDALRILGQHLVRDRLTRLRREPWDLLVDLIVPGDVGNQVLDQGKRPHRPYVNLLIDKLINARLAHEARPAVDLRAAGAAFGGLAVPATGEVVREVRLDVVHRDEHDHALDRRYLEALLLSAIGIAAKDPQDDRPSSLIRHGRGSLGAHVRTGCLGGGDAGGCDAVCEDVPSANSLASSGGISGTGRVLSLTRPPSLYAIKFTRPSAGSFSR